MQRTTVKKIDLGFSHKSQWKKQRIQKIRKDIFNFLITLPIRQQAIPDECW